MVNQVINEIFRQMTITLTLPLDVPVRPMDAKGLRMKVLAPNPNMIVQYMNGTNFLLIFLKKQNLFLSSSDTKWI